MSTNRIPKVGEWIVASTDWSNHGSARTRLGTGISTHEGLVTAIIPPSVPKDPDDIEELLRIGPQELQVEITTNENSAFGRRALLLSKIVWPIYLRDMEIQHFRDDDTCVSQRQTHNLSSSDISASDGALSMQIFIGEGAAKRPISPRIFFSTNPRFFQQADGTQVVEIESGRVIPLNQETAVIDDKRGIWFWPSKGVDLKRKGYQLHTALHLSSQFENRNKQIELANSDKVVEKTYMSTGLDIPELKRNVLSSTRYVSVKEYKGTPLETTVGNLMVFDNPTILLESEVDAEVFANCRKRHDANSLKSAVAFIIPNSGREPDTIDYVVPLMKTDQVFDRALGRLVWPKKKLKK